MVVTPTDPADNPNGGDGFPVSAAQAKKMARRAAGAAAKSADPDYVYVPPASGGGGWVRRPEAEAGQKD